MLPHSAGLINQASTLKRYQVTARIRKRHFILGHGKRCALRFGRHHLGKGCCFKHWLGQKRDWHSRDGQSGHDWALDQPWMHSYRIAQHGADGAGRPPGNRPAMVHRVAAIIIGGGVERKSVTESSTPSMRRFLPHLSQLYFCYKRQKPNWKMPAHRKRHPFRRRQKFSQDHRKNSGCTRSIRPKL
jgi:hypothetical protein